MKGHYEQTGAGQHPIGVAVSAPVRPSRRSGDIHYAIRDILIVAQEAQAAGKELISLNIGNPNAYDFYTPAHIIEAAYQAMRAGHNGYAPSEGVGEALEAIRKEASAKGIRHIQDVFITSGVSEGIEIAVAALMDTGDNLLIPAPGYPLYEATLAKLGLQGVHYDLDEGNGWQPDVDQIARLINNKTRGIVLINPNNPTGAIFHQDVLRAILDLAARHGILPITDEIYDKLLLEPEDYVPLASLAAEQPVLTFNGLSKAYVVPGFRIGWGILSGHEREVADYREAVAKMLRVRLCASHPMQYCIRPALEGDQGHIPVMVEKLRRRRDLIVSLLDSIPNIRCFTPRAAFYAFPRLEIDRPDEEFVAELIRQTGVVVVPGTGFGMPPGTRHFRLVFLPPEETLAKALGLIREFAKQW